MKKIKSAILGVTLLAASALSSNIKAATPDELLQEYTSEAKKSDKAFKGFSADAGKKLFMAERTNSKGEKVSCTKCHTTDPTKSGKTRAGMVIEPMAVSTNKERFTDKAKVEKWFKRNCQDVYERACTVQEKGDFIAFMKIAK